MKDVGNKRYLESFKVFPYIAWGLSLLFAFFVYQIAVDLRHTADDLRVQTEFLQTHIDAAPGNIKNFDVNGTTQ